MQKTRRQDSEIGHSRIQVPPKVTSVFGYFLLLHSGTLILFASIDSGFVCQFLFFTAIMFLFIFFLCYGLWVLLAMSMNYDGMILLVLMLCLCYVRFVPCVYMRLAFSFSAPTCLVTKCVSELKVGI